MGEQILGRIDAWQAAGLIDAATAERLRAAEGTAVRVAAGPENGPDNPLRAAGAMFGPPVSIMELFGYIGTGFLLAAWHVLAPTSDFTESPNIADQSIRWLVPAIAFTAVGVVARSGSPRLGRAAGVAFAVAAVHAGGLFEGIIRPGYLDPAAVAVAGLTTLVAAAFRRFHPAVLTQLSFLVALLYLAGVAFRWLSGVFFSADDYNRPMGEATAEAILTIGWWLAWAIALGVLARLEWRIGDDAPPTADPDEEAAARRGRVTRLIAGSIAIFGVAAGAMLYGSEGRALPAWLGDLAILAVSGALLGIAIRFGALAYLLPAAIGFIVALTDLNSQYVVERTGIGVALVLEGGILIGAGAVADRLRRMMARRRGASPAPPPTLSGPEPPATESAPEVAASTPPPS